MYVMMYVLMYVMMYVLMYDYIYVLCVGFKMLNKEIIYWSANVKYDLMCVVFRKCYNILD